MSYFAKTDALRAVRGFLNVDHAALAVYGATAPRALLLCGPPGVGKTKAVHLAAEQIGLQVYSVLPGPNVHRQLRHAFQPAGRERKGTGEENSGPSGRVVFLDEIDAICPAGALTASSPLASSKAANLLLSFMDPPRVKDPWNARLPQHNVFVIAATNRPNAIDPALRRPGRFDVEVMLLPPTGPNRFQILAALEPAADEDVLRYIADRAAGFVPADLAAMCKRARQIEAARDEPQASPSRTSLLEAFHSTTPSVLRESIAAEVPECSWDEIGGLVDVKRRLQMAVEWPLRYPDTFLRLGLTAPRGILLHGPPGCSKTTLVRAAAFQSHAAFLRLNGADIYSCYLGEAERILRQGFASARAAAPCILFLDEIDAIVGKRAAGGQGQSDGNGVQERVLSTLLTEMDGVVSASGVLVIGATNRVDLLDDALLRPGRFDDILEVGLPDEDARLQILEIHSSKLPLALDVDLEDIAKRTFGKSGADLKSMCMDAGLTALREQFSGRCANRTEEDCREVPLKVNERHFML